MKHNLFLTIFFLLSVKVSFAQRLPDWVTNTPTPTNNTYLFVVESAFGTSEISARNQAIARIFQSTAMRLGQPINSEEINRAVQSGTSFDVISRNYNIPINKVCEYTENKSGNYRVYILCQVAKSGNISVQFDAFNACYEETGKFYAAEALYADGYKILKNDYEIDDGTARSLFANSRAYSFYDRGMRMEKSIFNEKAMIYVPLFSGIIFAGFGYGFSTFLWDEGDKEKEIFQTQGKIGLGLLAFAGACALVKVVINSYGKAQIRKAVNLYNNGALYSQNAIEMKCGFTGNGVYLSFSF